MALWMTGRPIYCLTLLIGRLGRQASSVLMFTLASVSCPAPDVYFPNVFACMADAVMVSCRLKLQLPGRSTTTPADAPRPQLSTAAVASIVVIVAAVGLWLRLQHS